MKWRHSIYNLLKVYKNIIVRRIFALYLFSTEIIDSILDSSWINIFKFYVSLTIYMRLHFN